MGAEHQALMMAERYSLAKPLKESGTDLGECGAGAVHRSVSFLLIRLIFEHGTTLQTQAYAVFFSSNTCIIVTKGNVHVTTTQKYVEFNCVMTRSRSSDSWGFAFQKHLSTGKMVVTRIEKHGIADQQTKLQVGDIILAINHVGCSAATHNGIKYNGLCAQDAGKLLKQSTNKVTIQATSPSSMSERTVLTGSSMEIMEAVITRDDKKKPPLGFTIGQHDAGAENKYGDLYVKKTIPGGLITQQHTGLRPGHVIVNVNGKDTRGMTVPELGILLKSQQTVTIRATPRVFPKDTICRTVVTKPTASTPLGMILSNNDGKDSAFIKSIKNDSLMYHTGFQKGFTLLEVNGVNCTDKSLEEIGQILAALPAGPVTLKAKAP